MVLKKYRPKPRRKQEPREVSRASKSLFFWRRLFIWIIQAVKLSCGFDGFSGQRTGVKARDCQVFHRYFFKDAWNRSKWAPPTTPPWTAGNEVLVPSRVRRKEKNNLSLRGCNHGLAFLQRHSLGLHRGCGSKAQAMNLKWYCMKNMMRKWEQGYRKVGWRATKADTICVLCSRPTDRLPVPHTNTHAHLLISAPAGPSTVGVTVVNSMISGVGWPRLKSWLCYFLAAWLWVSHLISLSIFLIWIKGIITKPPVVYGKDQRVHVYRMLRTVSGIQEVIIW